MLDAVPVVADRLRGGFVRDQLVAALLSALAPSRSKLAQARGVAGRRLVFDVGLTHGWWPTGQLVQTALQDSDVRIRSRAAEAVAKDAVWTHRRKPVDRLAAGRHPEVRAVAVTGLVRLGDPASAVRFLDDPAPLVRAIARDAARQTGTNALDCYRHALATDGFTVGTIAGLTETGTPAEADLLRPLLRHGLSRIRAAAVRGFAALDPTRVRELVGMLDDPSPAVIREATLALRPVAGTLPPDLGWTLLTDTERAERRRAGYRLLVLGDTHQQLRVALIAAGDPNARLARRAAADATSIVRDATGTTWRRRPRPHLHVSPDQLAELRQLADTGAAALTDETAQQLRDWLDHRADGQNPGRLDPR
jgi:HEAT repeat protein